MNSSCPLLLALCFAVISGCASAQTAIERRFIPDAALAAPDFAAADNTSELRPDNTPWNAFLARYVVAGADGVIRVAYSSVTPDDRALLGEYIASLEAADPSLLNSDEQLAFWINLYNAATVALIIDHYPVASIRDIKSGPFDFAGPWNDRRVTVAGTALSLNDIEHGVIRAVYDDPRIHYAVNCASIGCPDLRREAYEGATLDAALYEQARAYINHARGVSRDEKGRITASKIFAWYKEDFGENEAAVLDHIRHHAAPLLAEALAGARKIHHYRYDWTLNEAAQ